ncbi:hypothetical protein G7Y89_g8157 [Cudoniella acicularis]|uniref:ML-like domain-containing protein n=1 Tax=Cudoniella acicularis TaxID=354080 RepID=A0A8H4W344_9HELO|nr:hypothetical protein G7Y89_g8157 [Cudoniella acicularis]
MARFPSFPASWATAFVSSLAILNTIIPSVQAQTTVQTIQGTNAQGVTQTLLVDRYPALYTGSFGDCMGGQSLINLTSFDAAYYADNMTVLFNLAGTTNLRNESLMLHISVEAYGEDRFDLLWNPCNANFASLCPLNASVPLFGQANIPVSSSDVSGIPSIALSIPDFEGSAVLRIFANSTQTQIACFSAVMSNGASFSHTSTVGTVLGIFTAVALLASFATAIYGVSIPHIRTHYAHSLSVLVVFEVFQSIFFSGALSLNWPSVLPAFWSNFAWASGMIYTESLINSINGFTGVSGNSSQVGGAGSSTLNTQGGLQQQIYGRSLEQLAIRGEEIASHMYKRDLNSSTDPRLYAWAGLPASPGLPQPGNWSGFPGTLSDVNIPAADAFTVGFIWLLILIAILVGAAVAFKWILEGFAAIKWIKHDRLALFRSHWRGFTGLIVLRTTFIAFFMMMTLCLYQFSYGGKAGPIAIAVIVFLIFFGGILSLAFYACFYRVKFGSYESKPDRIHFQRKKVMKFIPWFGTARESELEAEQRSKSAGSVSFFRLDFVGNDAERQSVHDNTDYIKRFGWLSARYRRSRWWFFAFWVVYQFVRACFVGGARASPTAQVIGLFIWEFIAFIAIAKINPFEGARNTALAVWMLGISKVATAGISIAFLPQYNVARILTTVLGVVIIVIQGFLVIGLLILIALGAISSYMSLTRNREEFKPHNLDHVRTKYFEHVELKATDLPPPPPPVPEEPKEPYFNVNTVRRAPKIEDEDVDFVPDMESMPHPAASTFSLANRNSGANSMANSMRSHNSFGNIPYGARVHRASWSSREFQNWQNDEIHRADSPLNTPSRHPSGHNTANNSVRKYGVATVWLVATLGAKSNTKKLTRKAICDVDVRKACETIMEPEAPMALRLQSNLLYGVARVYSQQCGYVLTDAQSAQTAMRDLLRVTRNNELDPNAGKARADQLVLADDPAFIPDLGLPAFDFDFLILDHKNDSQRSSQSMMSIRHRSGSGESSISLPNINLPSSSSHGAYQLPINDPFGGDIVQKPFGGDGGIFGEEEVMIYDDDDVIFEFDPDGNMRDIPLSEREARHAGSVHPQGHLGSDSAASGRVRKDHEDGLAGGVLPVIDGEGDFDMINYDEDAIDLPQDAEPFPPFNEGLPLMSGALQGQDKHLHSDYRDRVHSSEKPSSDGPSSVSAEAPQRKKKKKLQGKKNMLVDQRTALRNSDLIQWRDQYLQNMAEATAHNMTRKANLQAKKNAIHFVHGIGLNGVGGGLGSMNFASPLNMFAGESLLAKFTGIPLPAIAKRKKRARTVSEEEEDEQSPKRLRHEEEEVGRAFEEDAPMMNFEEDLVQDQSIEVGRDAASALPDYPSSAVMPWNVSASLHSHQRGASSKGLGAQVGGSVAGRRLTSASPLIGRGSAMPGELDNFSLLNEEEDNIMYGRDDDFESMGGDLGVSSSRGGTAPLVNEDEFEIFGPAANVDTQTAGTSQWVRQALDRESNNFFEYVKNTIEEKSSDELEGDEFADVAKGGVVTFDELFDPEANTAIVAAQAFYHVLGLVTKGKVRVEQEGVEELKPFGTIKISVLSWGL